jgi:hypothetical protein
MVLGYFLGLELQKLLMGCLTGTFIYEFLKSLKVLSVYESIKILLVREPLHVALLSQFGGWAHFRVKSSDKLPPGHGKRTAPFAFGASL